MKKVFAEAVCFNCNKVIGRLSYAYLNVDTFSGCGSQMTGEGGFFTSPNYPEPYPVNLQCVWTIVTAPGDTIELKFQEFHLENSGSCGYDFVEIRDGSSLLSPLIGKFCSSKIIGPINSVGNSLFIRLTSDGTVSEKGFRASWRRISHSISSTPASTTQATTTRATTTRETTTLATTTMTPTTPLVKGTICYFRLQTSITALTSRFTRSI